jgi:hypothetical protein
MAMREDVRRYLSDIGRRGGQRSRRRLDPDTARRMVRVREAKRAFRRFRTRCFWSFDPDYPIREQDIPWVADLLMRFGGREGWTLGAKLCR